MNILVCGGAGYVGSHCVRALCAAGHTVTVLDNLTTGHAQAVLPPAKLIQGDLADTPLLDRLFTENGFDAVLHFAACIEVGESVKRPLKFYANNVACTVNLLSVMEKHGVKRFVFSSTCANYGEPDTMPLTEDLPLAPVSPYAKTKTAVEWALADCAAAWDLGYAALRYFNAAGASHDAVIGEDHDPETHLIPNVLFVPLGRREKLYIFGTDYPTPDGTCVRDYVHVEDLADAHVRAVEILQPGDRRIYNAGTGRGASVREVIETCRQVTGHPIPAEEQPRRPGDVPELYADSSKIQRELGWTPKYDTLEPIIRSAWSWHKSHPNGFGDG